MNLLLILIPTVNSMELRISMEAHFCTCPGERFHECLTQHRRPTLNVGSSISSSGILNLIQGRRLDTSTHSSPLPDCGYNMASASKLLLS